MPNQREHLTIISYANGIRLKVQKTDPDDPKKSFDHTHTLAEWSDLLTLWRVVVLQGAVILALAIAVFVAVAKP